MLQEGECVGSRTRVLVTSLVHTPTLHQLNGFLLTLDLYFSQLSQARIERTDIAHTALHCSLELWSNFNST